MTLQDPKKELVQVFGNMEGERREKATFDPLTRQIFAAFGPILLTACSALVSGYSAILLPQLNQPSSSIRVSKSQESWIASMAALPMAAGCLAGGWAMDEYGRSKASIMAAILTSVGWILIYFSTTVEHLLIGRLVTGFCVGLSSPPPTVYLGEISHPRYRGMFLAATRMAVALGFFIPHLLGTFMSWRAIALVAVFLPIICVVAFICTPESHVWYANRGELEEAERAFVWFRGSENKAELVKILAGAGNAVDFKWGDCFKGSFIKPFLILNLFFLTVQFSGTNAVVFYSVGIMQNTVGGLDEYVAMLLVDVLRVVMSVVGCFTSKRYNVRPLTIVSGLGTAFWLYFLSVFVNLSKVIPDSVFISMLPMLGFVGFIVMSSMGLLPIPWTLCSELFPPQTKGVGGGICTCVNFLALFAVVKTNPDMFELLGVAGTFGFYASFVLVGTVVLFFVLPETKNRTLKDIEDFFVKQNGKEITDV